MAKKKEEVPKPPQAESTRKLPDCLGGGEVRLYDAYKGLPDLVQTPPEKLLAECQWFLVHFPSRKWVAVNAGRLEGMRQLKKLHGGVDEWHWLPTPTVKKSSKAKESSGTRTDASAREDAPPRKYTEVPEGADFDQAMVAVFPVQRLMHEYERLLWASETVYDREGNEVGEKPAFTVQFQALRSLVEYHQGRPLEKAKKIDERPVLTLEEMREKMIKSPAYLEAIEEMMKEAKAAAEIKRNAPKIVTPPKL